MGEVNDYFEINGNLMRYRYYPTVCTFTTDKDHQINLKSNKLSLDGICQIVTRLPSERIIKDTQST